MDMDITKFHSKEVNHHILHNNYVPHELTRFQPNYCVLPLSHNNPTSKNPSQYYVMRGKKKVTVKVRNSNRCEHMIMYIPSMSKLAVLEGVVALLLAEYWYTPGKVPVTVSVLR
jgi:hypothetical protein